VSISPINEDALLPQLSWKNITYLLSIKLDDSRHAFSPPQTFKAAAITMLTCTVMLVQTAAVYQLRREIAEHWKLNAKTAPELV